MDRRILILSASVGSGHTIAARALEESLRNRLGIERVRTLDVLETTPELYRTFYDDAYFGLVEAVPWLVGWGYDANNPPFKLGGSISLWDRINTTSTVRSIREFRPDIVLCTHFLPARLVSLMLTRGSFSTRLAVITTDYDFQGLWLSNTFNHFYTAREETRAHLIGLGLPADRLTASGIPVRAELGRPLDDDARAAVRARYGLEDGVPTLLISAGAAGGGYALGIVRQVRELTADFRAVVVCGRNAQLEHAVRQLVDGHDRRFRVLGYTTEMPELMRVADLFVGKPGGLSASEAMAAGLPMVLIKPIPGQEERNSDFLLEEGAAIRCNYDTTVGWKIDRLLAEPGRLAAMAEHARRIGRPHAAGEITSAVLADTREQLWISHAAQRSILASSERGIAPSDLQADRRIRTLVDTGTGRSVGLITEAQRRTVAKGQRRQVDLGRGGRHPAHREH
ncbi:processive 1,2-diacylglycerol beta-glucosyltransferase [Friedmanniella endophytica]|uniref:Processive 1,2-diacylglycerol beta-glucosyltransferase n=1 Tax=Microlunatus kandeliicorticis TaxID=1759536 RepID=A0A7W3P4Y6_9ACTN|nr:glycosyltransferase [Microlunatus kandeliicorticis]MBA8793394.1 processive 1,2-diacylglycerol beta-glucosyltransferase [Microlunatus kandeliicorticis]